MLMKDRLIEILARGITIPSGSGQLITYPDIKSYKLSKEVDGFVHKYPIILHVRGGNPGESEEFINRFLSIEEAEGLVRVLKVCIDTIKLLDGKDE